MNALDLLPKRIRWYKLSNWAIRNVLVDSNDFQVVSATYEDWNSSDYEAERNCCELIEHLMPGQCIWVETGDYIMVEAGKGSETYDPHYRLIAIRKNVWESNLATLIESDRAWRESAYRKAGKGCRDLNAPKLPYQIAQQE